MIKKLLTLLMALVLMASFYLYALMREDEETKRSEQWVVAGGEELKAFGGLDSTDGKALARAMGSLIPLPEQLSAGQVTDSSYHGYYVRQLRATDGLSTVLGVRPASASPLIRPEQLSFQHTDRTLLNYPLLKASDELYSYYYLVTDAAAFILQLPRESETETLRGFLISQP